MSAIVFYYRRSEFTTDSKLTIRSKFSTGGSFGQSLGVAVSRRFSQESCGNPDGGNRFLHIVPQEHVPFIRRCPSTVSCTVPSGESPNPVRTSFGPLLCLEGLAEREFHIGLPRPPSGRDSLALSLPLIFKEKLKGNN